MEKLGLLKHPTVDTIINLAADARTTNERRTVLINFFIEHFKDYYSAKPINSSCQAKFIPLERKANLASPQQCFAENGSEILGFQIMRSDLCSHANKLGVRLNPSPTELITQLKLRQPESIDQAKMIFQYLATQQSHFTRLDWSLLSSLRFIPVSKRDKIIYYYPREVFLTGEAM